MKINGYPILFGVVDKPLTGVWHAEIETDADTEVAGAVEITSETHTLRGTVKTVKKWGARQLVVVQGGAGKLRQEVSAKHYRVTTRLAIARDILSTVGESLAPSSSYTDGVAAWTRPKGRASTALTLAAPGWRVLDDGSILASPTSFSAVSGIFDPFEYDSTLGAWRLDSEDLAISPGSTVEISGQGEIQVGRVKYLLEEKEISCWVASV